MTLTRRFNHIGVVFSLVAVLIVVQMVRTQVNAASYSLGNSKVSYTETENPDRGNIYDRWGSLLAGNVEVYEVGLELRDINVARDAQTIATEVAPILEMDPNLILQVASTPFEEGKSVYVVLKDFVTADVINQLEVIKQKYTDLAVANQKKWSIFRDDNLPSLYSLTWNAHLKRSYPETKLASNILGFFAFLDPTGIGANYGVEEEYNDFLGGKSISVTYQVDPGKITDLPEVPEGANIILTIDREIQAMAERVLDHAVDTSKSVSGTMIIMDPETGEILAMAVTPRIDPNNYWDFQAQIADQQSYNRAIDVTFEPGSTFKVLTMAAALDAKVVEPTTEFLDTGSIVVGGHRILNWDGSAWGPQTMIGCMQHSLNVCLAWISSEKLGASAFYHYMDVFGIGHRTNVDLAGEKVYPLSVPDDPSWSLTNLGTNAFGQGVAVTPLQLITAIAAVANDGRMMAPHLVKTIFSSNQRIDIQPHMIGQPITAETAHTLTDMLATSLEQEASNALVDGYRIAGKTGTAEIPTETGYNTDLTNASFIGWGPADDPKFIVYIWLEKPKSSPWGSVVVAPVFKSVVTQLVGLMNLPPDSVRLQLSSP